MEITEKICEVLPYFKPIQPRAMFFDLAQSNLIFPDLNQKIEK